MADEIVQTLGFDASSALEALAALDTGLGGFEQHMKSLGETMTTWNSQAGTTVSILKDIASNADLAASAIAKLSGAFGAQQAKGPVGRPLGANDMLVGAGFSQAANQAAEQVQGTMAPVTVPITPKVDSKPIQEGHGAHAAISLCHGRRWAAWSRRN